MNKTSNLLWGIVFIVVGVIFGLNALDITNINIFFSGWWTLFIIIPCFIDLFKDEAKTGNIIGLVIGILLLLGCQDIIDLDILWKLLLPAILVMIGLSFIFKDTLNKGIKKKIKELKDNNENVKEHCATFSEQKVDYTNEEFTGCDLTAVFGGVKCDLRDAIIKEDQIITVSAIFGGITIYLPKDVNVKVTSTSIFGGISDDRHKKTKDGKITVYISGTCLFGGVDIK